MWLMYNTNKIKLFFKWDSESNLRNIEKDFLTYHVKSHIRRNIVLYIVLKVKIRPPDV